jgi:hypothetical protein
MNISSNALSYPHPRGFPTQDEVLANKIEIHRLDKDISDLETQIKELQSRLAPLQRERTNRASYISPLRRLPVETLIGIIHICLENGVKMSVLTQICGTIRDAVIEMPTLWNNIRIWDSRRQYNPTVRLL